MKKLIKESLSEEYNPSKDIKTIKDLKEIINDLPNDMEVAIYNGGNGDLLYSKGHWIISEETLTDEEIRDGYPEGVISTFVISVD